MPPITVMQSYVAIGREYAGAEPERIGHSIVVEEPIGVCTFITPWNYPLHQIVGKVAPLRSLRPELPADLEAVVLRAMARARRSAG